MTKKKNEITHDSLRNIHVSGSKKKKRKKKENKKKEKHAWDKTRIKEGYYTWWREKHLPFVIKILALAWRISRKLEIKSGIAYSNQHIVPKRRRK